MTVKSLSGLLRARARSLSFLNYSAYQLGTYGKKDCRSSFFFFNTLALKIYLFIQAQSHAIAAALHQDEFRRSTKLYTVRAGAKRRSWSLTPAPWSFPFLCVCVLNMYLKITVLDLITWYICTYLSW